MPWNVYALAADQSDKLCRITDGLYLSSQYPEKRKELLVKKGVTHILQVRAREGTRRGCYQCSTAQTTQHRQKNDCRHIAHGTWHNLGRILEKSSRCMNLASAR